MDKEQLKKNLLMRAELKHLAATATALLNICGKTETVSLFMNTVLALNNGAAEDGGLLEFVDPEAEEAEAKGAEMMSVSTENPAAIPTIRELGQGTRRMDSVAAPLAEHDESTLKTPVRTPLDNDVKKRERGTSVAESTSNQFDVMESTRKKQKIAEAKDEEFVKYSHAYRVRDASVDTRERGRSFFVNSENFRKFREVYYTVVSVEIDPSRDSAFVQLFDAPTRSKVAKINFCKTERTIVLPEFACSAILQLLVDHLRTIYFL